MTKRYQTYIGPTAEQHRTEAIRGVKRAVDLARAGDCAASEQAIAKARPHAKALGAICGGIRRGQIDPMMEGRGKRGHTCFLSDRRWKALLATAWRECDRR